MKKIISVFISLMLVVFAFGNVAFAEEPATPTDLDCNHARLTAPIYRKDRLSLFSVEEYKGLEADMVLYIHGDDSIENLNYIAYTRAKYYLIELVRTY